MKIVTKKEMENLIEEFPEGGIVFAEYTPDVLKSELMVTNGRFGATTVIPYNGEPFDFDWTVKDYVDDELFAVFDDNDVLQMIQMLTSGLKVKQTPACVPHNEGHLAIAKSGPCYIVYRYTCCGYEHAESKTDMGASEVPPYYCPNCGARIVD